MFRPSPGSTFSAMLRKDNDYLDKRMSVLHAAHLECLISDVNKVRLDVRKTFELDLKEPTPASVFSDDLGLPWIRVDDFLFGRQIASTYCEALRFQAMRPGTPYASGRTVIAMPHTIRLSTNDRSPAPYRYNCSVAQSFISRLGLAVFNEAWHDEMPTTARGWLVRMDELTEGACRNILHSYERHVCNKSLHSLYGPFRKFIMCVQHEDGELDYRFIDTEDLAPSAQLDPKNQLHDLICSVAAEAAQQ